MISILEDLRAATREVHARLHHHPSFGPVMAMQPDSVGYARLLTQLHGFHAPAETWLFDTAPRLVPELDDLPQRRKMPLLEADMTALGRLHPQTTRPHRPIDWAMASSRPVALGVLYVIEGATLGGRELGRKLAPVLNAKGLAGNAGRQFFLAYEPRQGVMWRRLCDVLNGATATLNAAERHELCASALRTFTMLEDWLTACHIEPD